MPRAYVDAGAYEGKNYIKGPTKGKNEEKGAYEGQNERNRLSKNFAPQISENCLGPTRALIRPCTFYMLCAQKLHGTRFIFRHHATREICI